VAAYLAAHPETVAFMKYIQQAPLPSSFANGTYYSINAFRFINAAGEMHFVRWRMEPETPFAALDKSKLATLGKNFLFDELVTRMEHGPLRWHLILALAAPGDPVNDATKEWPADRERVDAGTLVLDHISSEDDGPCNAINFDPLILPVGITGSDDPLLSARSAAYSVSLTRRAGEAPQPSKISVPTEGAGQ
jgi:catalase